MKRSVTNGFSLVELSIVLVILGLLVGGVLSGQSLIRASELRSITTQYQQYFSATNAFRDKYFALPGDMNNATKFWGQHATIATCAASGSTDTTTCDGDGDGKVTYGGFALMENFRFWQHLANAGLIEGSYSGFGDDFNGTYGVVPKANYKAVPLGKISPSVWIFNYFGDVGVVGLALFQGSYRHAFVALSTLPGDGTYGYIFLKPEEAWNIDKKLDDGKPATGSVVGGGADDGAGSTDIGTCANTSNNALLTADYKLGSSDPGCTLMFRGLF